MEWQFLVTFEDETFFHPLLSSYCSGVIGTLKVAPTALALQAVQVWWEMYCNERHFTLADETCFLSLSRRTLQWGN
jgi:hypothetical protein